MIYIVDNAGPILAAAFAAWVFGLAWYGALFPSATKQSLGSLALDALAKAWLAAILAGALILAPVEAGGWTIALGSAFIIWVGFVLPVLVSSYARRAIEWKAILLDVSHWLLAMLIMAAVLHTFGLDKPTTANVMVAETDIAYGGFAGADLQPSEVSSLVPIGLPGEYRVAGIDGDDIVGTIGIALSIDEKFIRFAPGCAGYIWLYEQDGQTLSAQRVGPPRGGTRPACPVAMALQSGQLASALDSLTGVERTAENGLLLVGTDASGARSVTLFSQ